MKIIMRNLTCTLLVAAAALGTARPQSASQGLRLSDIRAQQPQETIFASALCEQVLEAPKGLIFQHYKVEPNTLVPDLNTLVEMSDEVVLAGFLENAVVLSPSRKSPATYYEVKVIRAWKGPHHPGDFLTWGTPFGALPCEPPSPPKVTPRLVLSPENYGVPPALLPPVDSFNYAYLLFLRKPNGDERLVQGLRPAAGGGVQGIFLIPVAMGDDCFGPWGGVNVPHCDAIMQTSQRPVIVPYAHDPLVKKYAGMPASEFLREVQSVAASQSPAEKASSK